MLAVYSHHGLIVPCRAAMRQSQILAKFRVFLYELEHRPHRNGATSQLIPTVTPSVSIETLWRHFRYESLVYAGMSIIIYEYKQKKHKKQAGMCLSIVLEEYFYHWLSLSPFINRRRWWKKDSSYCISEIRMQQASQNFFSHNYVLQILYNLIITCPILKQNNVPL